MVHDFFPPKERNDMSDRGWETYCILTWLLSTADVLTVRYRLKPRFTQGANIEHQILDILDRYRAVTTMLLKETGRASEFEELLKEEAIKKGLDISHERLN